MVLHVRYNTVIITIIIAITDARSPISFRYISNPYSAGPEQDNSGLINPLRTGNYQEHTIILSWPTY